MHLLKLQYYFSSPSQVTFTDTSVPRLPSLLTEKEPRHIAIISHIALADHWKPHIGHSSANINGAISHRQHGVCGA